MDNISGHLLLILYFLTVAFWNIFILENGFEPYECFKENAFMPMPITQFGRFEQNFWTMQSRKGEIGQSLMKIIMLNELLFFSDWHWHSACNISFLHCYVHTLPSCIFLSHFYHLLFVFCLQKLCKKYMSRVVIRNIPTSNASN